jgi:hypothetical protein
MASTRTWFASPLGSRQMPTIFLRRSKFEVRARAPTAGCLTRWRLDQALLVSRRNSNSTSIGSWEYVRRPARATMVRCSVSSSSKSHTQCLTIIRSRSDIRAGTLFHKAAELNLTLMNNLAHWLVSSFFLKELRLRVVQSEDVQ